MKLGAELKLVYIPLSGVPKMGGVMPEVWEQSLKKNFLSLPLFPPDFREDLLLPGFIY